MLARRNDTMRQALVGLVLSTALAVSAGAAPLRLSLASLAVPGPTGEAVEPPGAAPVESPETPAAQDLSFMAAPDLQFPEAGSSGGGADDEWLQSAHAQHDEAAAADRSLGAFAPAVTPALRISTDPIDEVTLTAARPDAALQAAASDATPSPMPATATWAWMTASLLAVGAGLALWARRGAPAAGTGRSAARVGRRQAVQVV